MQIGHSCPNLSSCCLNIPTATEWTEMLCWIRNYHVHDLFKYTPSQKNSPSCQFDSNCIYMITCIPAWFSFEVCGTFWFFFSEPFSHHIMFYCKYSKTALLKSLFYGSRRVSQVASTVRCSWSLVRIQHIYIFLYDDLFILKLHQL